MPKKDPGRKLTASWGDSILARIRYVIENMLKLIRVHPYAVGPYKFLGWKFGGQSEPRRIPSFGTSLGLVGPLTGCELWPPKIAPGLRVKVSTSPLNDPKLGDPAPRFFISGPVSAVAKIPAMGRWNLPLKNGHLKNNWRDRPVSSSQ